MYIDTQNTYMHKNESKHSEMGPVNKTQSREMLDLFICVCALHCAQLLCTILHRTDLIIFPLTLQTITVALMMSIWGKGVHKWQYFHRSNICNHHCSQQRWFYVKTMKSSRFDSIWAIFATYSHCTGAEMTICELPVKIMTSRFHKRGMIYQLRCICIFFLIIFVA